MIGLENYLTVDVSDHDGCNTLHRNVTRSRLLQRVQRSSGQYNAGRGRGQINVLTGAVLKKARARGYLGRLTSVCVLCCRPRGMLEAASSGASGSASFGRVPSHC